MALAPEPWSRRFGRLVVAGALAGASLALPACGGEGAAPPADPGGNVDPGATGVVGGSINKAKDAADAADQRQADLESRSTQP